MVKHNDLRDDDSKPKVPRYTLSRCRKNDKLYGKVHGSQDNDGMTLCGMLLNETWWVVENNYNGQMECQDCIRAWEKYPW